MRFVIVALVMVLATNVGAQEAGGVAGESPTVSKEQPGNTENPARQPKRFSVPVTIIETPEQASESARREQKTDAHEAADLDAQVRAANATERAAATAERQEIPAWAQIIIGGMSTFIALVALGVSLLTAIWAIRTTRAQTRAYVHAETAELTWGNNRAVRPMVTMTVQNTGQTPARWFSAQFIIFTKSLNVDGTSTKHTFAEVDLTGRNRKRWNALGGGSLLSFPAFHKDYVKIMQESYGRDDLSLNIAGIIRYETFFGEIFDSEFWFTSRPIPEFRFEKKPTPGGALARYGVPESGHKMQRASCILNTYVHRRFRWWQRKPTD